MAGRVMARRFMGKLAFMSLVDDSGSIQVYLDRAVIDGTSGEDAFKCAPSQTAEHGIHVTAVAGTSLGCSGAAGGAKPAWPVSSPCGRALEVEVLAMHGVLPRLGLILKRDLQES